MKEIELNSIEEAIREIRAGRVVIVVDDEDRENEGDFICAAETITPDIVNFMATHGRGLICAPILEEKADALDLPMMVNKNTALHETAFTVSIDLEGDGVTTGISTSDRAKTLQVLAIPDSKPEDFARPGHIFPLRAKKGGVLRRTGHTEASVDLAALAGLEPVGVLVEILNEDGSMARLPDLIKIAKQHDLKIISIEDLVAYRMKTESIVREVYRTKQNSLFGEFTIYAYEQITTEDVHLALVKGEIKPDSVISVRMHSSYAGEQIYNCLSDNESPITRAMNLLKEQEDGVIVVMRQEERSMNLLSRLKAMDQGKSSTKTTSEIQKDFGVGAQILRSLGVKKLRLISNNPRKRIGLDGYGLDIVGYQSY